MPAALVLDVEPPITVGALTLAERAVLLADRAGFSPVRVWAGSTLDAAARARLKARGVAVSMIPSEAAPLEDAPFADGVVILGSNVLFGPALLTGLVNQADAGTRPRAVAAYEGRVPLALYLPPGTPPAVRACRSVADMAAALAAGEGLRELPLAGVFCRHLGQAALAPAAERDYIRYLNGKGEGYFTKKIRKFSVPLTNRLVRLGAKPTQVTLAGLGLAMASAWSVAQGHYLLGVLGGILYYASMVFDCSDGEVARLTLRDSAFGAWLETIVDYLTYFLILGALTMASLERPGADAHRVAATIALAASIVVVVVAGYLRHRVAKADPGQFDDASAKALASSGRFHRFARWGRQWIKRSTVAHLIVFLALVNQLPVLLYLWAFGAAVASIVIVIVQPFVVRRVAVAPAKIRQGG